MKELKFWSGRFMWNKGEDREAWGQQHIMVAAYSQRQAADITGANLSEVREYWGTVGKAEDRARFNGKPGVIVVAERGERRGQTLFEGERIPGTTDAPVKKKVVGETDDIARTLWVTGFTGPRAFPVVGQTPLKWKVKVEHFGSLGSMPGALQFRLVDKNPAVFFEDWDECLQVCKDMAENELKKAQELLAEITARQAILATVVKPEGV